MSLGTGSGLWVAETKGLLSPLKYYTCTCAQLEFAIKVRIYEDDKEFHKQRELGDHLGGWGGGGGGGYG